MGVLADFYIAERKAAAAYDEVQECADEDRAQSTGITPLELSMLAAILDGKKWDVDLMNQFEEVLVVDGGERLIHEVSPALVDRLLNLSGDDDVARAAKAWSATKEIACAPDVIQPVIEDLIRLARRARETNRQLFLWNCV